MKRTQIYLDEGTIGLLQKMSHVSGKTRSDLIRKAIRETYDRTEVQKVVKRVVGLPSFKHKDIHHKVAKLRQIPT